MKIAIVGMSGTGKTYWSKKLQEKGFHFISCDDLIEIKLKDELKKSGYSGLKDVAKWMGQPYDKQYNKTSKQYLDAEKEVMKEISQNLEKGVYQDKPLIVDTTGSFIYVGDSILKKLAQQMVIVYLHTPESIQKQMYELYLKDPKPVIWGNNYKKQNNETDIEALQRSYANLLKYREKKYQLIGDIILDYPILRTKSFTVQTLLEVLSSIAQP